VLDAIRFRREALRGRVAVAARRPSSARGRQARLLALAAFEDFARAGSEWAASGRARINHQHAAARADAQAGARDARAGNLILVRAGALLR
jgi:hypothetical protein